MTALSSLLLALMLLMATHATAEPRLPVCAESPLRFELTAESAGETREVCISPDQPLVFRFDAPLLPGSPEVSGRERLEDVATGDRSIILIPRADLQPGESFEVKARFADGAAPTSATFRVVVHPVLGAGRVDVTRHARTLEDYQRDYRVEREKSQRIGEELERVLVERGPGGLTGLFASGLLQVEDTAGDFKAKSLTEELTQPSSNVLTVETVLSCRATTTRMVGAQSVVRVAVVMRVRNPSSLTWMLRDAALLRKGREPRRVRAWQSAPLAPSPSESGLVAVELEMTKQEARGTFTLKAWDESGQRLVTLGNVTFP